MENIMLDEKKKNIKIVGKYYWLDVPAWLPSLSALT